MVKKYDYYGRLMESLEQAEDLVGRPMTGILKGHARKSSTAPYNSSKDHTGIAAHQLPEYGYLTNSFEAHNFPPLFATLTPI